MGRHADKDSLALQNLLNGYRREVGNLEKKIGKKPSWSQSDVWQRRLVRLNELRTVLIPRMEGVLAIQA